MEAAEALGCQDAAAIRHLLSAAQLERAQTAPLVLGELAAFERPLPSITDYYQLLAQPSVRTPERVVEAVGADR